MLKIKNEIGRKKIFAGHNSFKKHIFTDYKHLVSLQHPLHNASLYIYSSAGLRYSPPQNFLSQYSISSISKRERRDSYKTEASPGKSLALSLIASLINLLPPFPLI
jgi:hypothetical protein